MTLRPGRSPFRGGALSPPVIWGDPSGKVDRPPAQGGAVRPKGYEMSVKHDDSKLDRERMEYLVRIYHSAQYAAEAIDKDPCAVSRAAKRYGLRFRRQGQPTTWRNDYAR